MSEYLHLRCGDCELLLDLACVEAVDFLADAAHDGSGRRLWRERSLPVLDLTAALGRAGDNRQQIVVVEGGQACLVELGEVLGLRHVEAADWQPLLAVSAEAGRFFDAALPAADGGCLLRLRRPLPWF